jgi:hypothetical protein
MAKKFLLVESSYISFSGYLIDMFINTSHKKIAAVLMMLIVFVIIMKSTSFAKEMSVSSGTNISQALYQADPVDTAKTAMGDFKPPKHSFVDYDFFFSCSTFIPLNPPHDSLLVIPLDTQAVPGAWLDIFIPPKI